MFVVTGLPRRGRRFVCSGTASRGKLVCTVISTNFLPKIRAGGDNPQGRTPRRQNGPIWRLPTSTIVSLDDFEAPRRTRRKVGNCQNHSDARTRLGNHAPLRVVRIHSASAMLVRLLLSQPLASVFLPARERSLVLMLRRLCVQTRKTRALCVLFCKATRTGGFVDCCFVTLYRLLAVGTLGHGFHESTPENWSKLLFPGTGHTGSRT